MNKEFTMTVAIFGVLIGGLIFRDQVLALFAGMTVMESLSYITQFVLHVVVVTIAVYVATTLPELVKPWMKALSHKSRRSVKPALPTEKRQAPMTAEQLMMAYIRSQLPKREPQRQAPAGDDARIEF